MGSLKSGGAPLAVAAAAPFHHASTRRGNYIGSIATLFALVSATSMSPVVPAPLVKTARFLQSVEDPNAHDEAYHEDHDHEGHVEDAFNVTQETQKEGENLPWGQVIFATFLVSLATFSGLLIIVSISAYRGILKLRGKLNPGDSNNGQSSVLRDICIFAFAAGAITATAVFLVLPEALHLIGGELFVASPGSTRVIYVLSNIYFHLLIIPFKGSTKSTRNMPTVTLKAKESTMMKMSLRPNLAVPSWEAFSCP